MKHLSVLVLSLLILTACVEQERTEVTVTESMPGVEMAVAVVYSTVGNSAEGTVTFTQTEEGVRVEANISGLDTNGIHGFHIHEFGDCRADDATSAGGHYNPMDMPHAGPMDEQRHVGDMGNLTANDNGVAEYVYLDEKIELSGVYSVLGLAVVVHAQEDDLESQPVGDAGGRIGCGIIGKANPDF